MTLREATFSLLNQLRTIYPEGEADSITDWVMEHLTGSKKVERMMYKNSSITTTEELQLKIITERLLQHEPVQYVLNEAWFCGLKFYVDNNVLIPRPETEELVEWIISTPIAIGVKFPVEKLSILDIGSGSGCIPVSLKRSLRKADVWSCDSSEATLKVASQNAATLGAEVNFIQLDFLDEKSRKQLPLFDIIVSNPPYIPEKNKEQMQSNVLNYEPATALFVPDNDALVFYRAIADFGKTHMNPGGAIYTEIHEELGPEAVKVYESFGYKTELKKDMQGKDRMVKAVF